MGAKSINAPRHAHAAKSFLPGNGIRLVAGFDRKSVGRFAPSTNEAVNSLLNIDEGLFHRPQGKNSALWLAAVAADRPLKSGLS